VNLARFTIQGSPSSARGYDTVSGASLVLQLEALTGVVRRVTYEVYSASDDKSPRASKGAALLTLVGSSTGQKVDAATPATAVSLNVPATGAASWVVRCLVNGGLDRNDRPSADFVFERLVCVRSALGRRKIIATEGTQYSAGGWADNQNDDVDVVPPGGGDVLGPASAVVDRVPVFQSANGKELKDGGIAVRDLFAYFNVKLGTYGASPAALAAANRVALQAALAAANTAGAGLVYVPDGLGAAYLVNESAIDDVCLSLTGLANVTLRGAGRGKTIIRAANGANANLFNIDGATEIEISDLTLDGNSQLVNPGSGNTSSVHGLRTGTGGCDGLRIHRVEIKNCYGYGLGLQGGDKKRVDLSHLYIHHTGADCIDMKNVGNGNGSMSLAHLDLRHWGLDTTLTEQAGLDIRGPCEVTNVWTSDGPPDGHYIRFREGVMGDPGVGFGGHRAHLSNFNCRGNDGATSLGVYIAADHVTVEGGYVKDMLLGVTVYGKRNKVIGVDVEDTGDEAFLVDSEADLTRLTDCNAFTAVGSGFRIRGPRTKVTDCTAEACAVAGLTTEPTAVFCEVKGFDATGTGSAGLSSGIDLNAPDAVVQGGSLTACSRGVILNGLRNKVVGTTSYGNADGFLIAAGADDASLLGVTARDNTDDGIQIRGDRAFIGGGSVVTGNTQNGIEIEGSADGTRIAETRISGNGSPFSDGGTNTKIGAAAIENDGIGGLVGSLSSVDVASAGTTANIDVPLLPSTRYLFRVKVLAEDASGDRGTKIVHVETQRSGSGAASTPVQSSLFTSGDSVNLTVNASISGNNLRLSVTNTLGADAHLTVRVTELERDPTVEDS
jgi:hypothetical protein